MSEPSPGVQVWLVVLGAVLALMTSLAIEYIRIQIAERRAKHLVRTLLKSEMPTILRIIESLLGDAGVLQYIPLTRVGEVDIARQGYDRNRDWTILFKEETFRDLFDFYLDLNTACRDTQFVEGLVSNPEYTTDPNWQAFVQNRRAEILEGFRDLLDKGRSLLNRINAQ